MAIRRISELDNISGELSIGTVPFNGDEFERFLFETSQFTGEVNEAPSYYLSKRVSLTDLCAFFTKDLYKIIDKLSTDLYTLSMSIGDQTWTTKVVQNWISAGMVPGDPDNYQYAVTNISCTNLSVQNDIHGCALSSKWI